MKSIINELWHGNIVPQEDTQNVLNNIAGCEGEKHNGNYEHQHRNSFQILHFSVLSFN